MSVKKFVIDTLLFKSAFKSRNLVSILLVVLLMLLYMLCGGGMSLELPKVGKPGNSFGGDSLSTSGNSDRQSDPRLNSEESIYDSTDDYPNKTTQKSTLPKASDSGFVEDDFVAPTQKPHNPPKVAPPKKDSQIPANDSEFGELERRLKSH